MKPPKAASSYLTLPLRLGTVEVAQVLLDRPLGRPLLLGLLGRHFGLGQLTVAALLAGRGC